MSEVQQQEQGGDKKHKKVRAKKSSTHIDMTPMVDLAFLLLTFFMLTTTFSKPKTMDITMPVKDAKEDEQTKVPASQTLSIILTEKDRIIWYMGEDNAEKAPETNIADFSLNGAKSIHKILLEKNQLVFNKIQLVRDSVAKGLIKNENDIIKQHISAVKSAEKKGLIVLIKPDDKSKYKNLVDILDEMLVCSVARYAIVDVSANEQELIKNTQ
jgi:biopolymer transport protein ExbD